MTNNCLLVTLKKCFKHFGAFVAGHVVACMVVPMVVTVLSCIGFTRFHIYENMKHGYTSLDAPSRHELQVFQKFYARQGEPYILGMFAEALDGGSMIRGNYLRELLDFDNMIMKDLNMTPTSVTYTFNDLCGHYCDMNKPVYLFNSALNDGASLLRSSSNLSFPIATFFSIKTNLAMNFYGVSLFSDKPKSTNGTELEKAIYCDLESVDMVALWYRADVQTRDVSEALREWEMTVYDLMNHKNERSTRLVLSPIGDHIVNYEVMRGGFATVPFFMFGAILLVSFVSVSVLYSTRCTITGRVQWHMIFVVASAVISPMMASFTVMGGVLMVHGHINVMMLVIPILVLAVGVDDAFLLLHCWHTQDIHKPDRTRLADVYAEIGPSTSITSLTNAIAFAIGAIVPTPELRLFCVTTSLAMATDWIFEMTFFSASMVLTDRMRSDHLANRASHGLKNGHSQSEKPAISNGKSPVKLKEIYPQNGDTAATSPLCNGNSEKADLTKTMEEKLKAIQGSFLSKYCSFLMSWKARCLAVVLLAVYWTGAISGLYLMKPGMDPRVLVPNDSPLNRALDIHESYLWNDYNPTLLVIQNVPDLTDDRNYDLLMNIIDGFEKLPHSTGSAGTMFWLRDYEEYEKSASQFDSLFGFYDEDTTDGSKRRTFDDLGTFLEMQQYKHWTHSIHWHTNSSSKSIVIDEFVLGVSYRNLSNLGEHAKLLQQLRHMAYQVTPPYVVTVYQLNAPFSDVILSVRQVTIRTLTVTLLSMAVVCAAFIGNVTGIVAAIVSVASICVGVLGYLHWWGAILNPITMSFSLMAVGFSVDFTAHVCFHYYSCEHVDGTLDRLEQTFKVVAWPMLQAGLSTALCMVSQAFTPLQAYSMLVKTILLVVFIGFFHGLFFLPVVFALFPQPRSSTAQRNRSVPDDFAGFDSQMKVNKSTRNGRRTSDRESQDVMEQLPVDV